VETTAPWRNNQERVGKDPGIAPAVPIDRVPRDDHRHDRGLARTGRHLASEVRVSRDREHGFQRIVSDDFRGL
jgi:hypothetical protein